MDRSNIEYLLGIFKELTTELPQKMIYRETDEGYELSTLGNINESPVLALDFSDNAWNLSGSQMPEVA